jgi:hypothetical protein
MSSLFLALLLACASDLPHPVAHGEDDTADSGDTADGGDTADSGETAGGVGAR